ncbi:MAG TPA: hypothetical protein VGH27_22340 [Streptosporangiaceae bacterium]
MFHQLTSTKRRAAARAALAATALALMTTAATAAASTSEVSQATAGPAGPAPISPLGHPGLCWEAWGNGSAVTLETCDPALNGQSWSFTGHNDVLLNGNGYCTQNGGSTPSSTNGAPPAGSDSMFLTFSGQCAGAPTLAWTFSGSTNQVTNTPAGVCAYVAGGALVPGAVIVARPCASAGRTSIWSMGVSDLALAAPPTAHTSAGQSAHGAASTSASGVKRDFTTAVEVSNPVAVSRSATAMTAYGATISIAPARGLTVTRLTGTGDLADWSCDAKALRCQGSLPGGGRGDITVLGAATGRAPAATLTAHATVTHTNQSRHATHVSAVLPVRVFAAPAAVSAAGSPGSSVTTFVLIAAVVLVLLGIFLAVATRRRRPAEVPPVVPVPPHETTLLRVPRAVTLIPGNAPGNHEAATENVAETRDNTAVLPAVGQPGSRPLLRHRGRPAGYRRLRLTAPVRHARPPGRRRPGRNQDAAAGPPK